MPVPAKHARRYLYHFTHLENLEGVIKNGFLSYNRQLEAGLTHYSIAASSIQARRSMKNVPCGPGGVIHDYVPLYFGTRSPMLLAQINAKNVDQPYLAHFAFPIDLVTRPNVVFTDAAANAGVSPRFFTDPVHLDELNWPAIDSTRWGTPDDEKSARMAEALVHGHLDPRDAAYVVVWNEDALDIVSSIFRKAGITVPVRTEGDDVGRRYYFAYFQPPGLPADMMNHSLASGPMFIKRAYDDALAGVLTARRKRPNARFQSTSELLAALQQNGLSTLPETMELIGLQSKNEMHKEDVGTHTLKVVDMFRRSADYDSFGDDDKVLIELAAYLHDIGKGPKSRWAACGGRQLVDPDHPLRSVAMLPRIVGEELADVTDREARILCKLVCYHDLVGDIVGTKQRKREQLLGVAENVGDLLALAALGRADMSSVNSAWAQKGHAVDALVEWARTQLPDSED